MGLRACRTCLLEALKPLGTMDDGLWGGDAIYIWARLPEVCWPLRHDCSISASLKLPRALVRLMDFYAAGPLGLQVTCMFLLPMLCS